MTSSEGECIENVCMKATKLLKLRMCKSNDFYLWEILRDKEYKTYRHTLEVILTTSVARFQHFPGKKYKELTTACSAGMLIAFGRDDKTLASP